MHQYLDPASDEYEEQYWSFTTEGLGEDVYASVKAMYENSGSGKGWYFGSSQGTASMQVALSKYDEEMNEYLNKKYFFVKIDVLKFIGNNDDTCWLVTKNSLMFIPINVT